MRIGVVANPGKPGAGKVLRELIALAGAHGVSTRLEASTARIIRGKGESFRSLLRKIDLLVVVGGDGSLLRVVHEVYPSPVPLLGINLGRLGFLTAVRHDELAAVLPDVFQGRLRTSPRLPLSVTLRAKRGKRKIACALNDVVFSRSSTRMAAIRVQADGLFLNDYIADGLVLATATGSTAYSLAAGGPIIAPEAAGLVLSPLCPHTLSNRSLVVSSQTRLRVESSSSEPLLLQYDGCNGGRLRPGEWAEVGPARSPVNLAFLARRDFFQILREKLKWSGAVSAAPGR